MVNNKKNKRKKEHKDSQRYNHIMKMVKHEKTQDQTGCCSLIYVIWMFYSL